MKITLNELRQIVKSIIKEEMTATAPPTGKGTTPEEIFKNLFSALYNSLGSYVTVKAGINEIFLQSRGKDVISIKLDSNGGGVMYLGELYKSKTPIQNFWKSQMSMDGAVKSFTKPDVYNIRVENPEIIKSSLLDFFKKFDPKLPAVTATIPSYEKK